MTVAAGVVGVSAAELALRLNALRGTAVYAAYLASLPDVRAAQAELAEELRALDSSVEIEHLSSRDGGELIAALATAQTEIVLADAWTFIAQDWALLDRRRSSLAHRGVLVLLTTQASFDELMRSAPNLASWLGAQVFAYVPEGAEVTAVRERRLEALRAWASRSDLDVIRAAEAGTLPREPEYAEWLVLLGRSDLLGPREP